MLVELRRSGRRPVAFQLGGKNGRCARARVALVSGASDRVIVKAENLRRLHDCRSRGRFELRRCKQVTTCARCAVCVVVCVMKPCAAGFDMSSCICSESDFSKRCGAQRNLRHCGDNRRNASQSSAQLEAHCPGHTGLTLAAQVLRGNAITRYSCGVVRSFCDQLFLHRSTLAFLSPLVRVRDADRS